MLSKEFWEKEKEMIDKLKSADKAKMARQILPLPPEAKKKLNPYGNYYKYHKKPKNHPDNRKKIVE